MSHAPATLALLLLSALPTLRAENFLLDEFAPLPEDNAPAALALRHAAMADALRRESLADAGRIPRPLLTAGLPAGEIQDFLAASSVFPGPFDEGSAVFAYYNPWWDALLFVRTADGRGRVPPRVEQAAWLSGETLRRETPSSGDARVRTVLPGPDTPLSTSLWRAHSASLASFRSLCPEGQGSPASLPTFVTAADPASERALLQSRAGLRLRLASLLAGDPTNAAVSARCCALLRSADEHELRRFFDSRPHRFFCRTLARLPDAVRSGFTPYGFVPARDGTLFLFANTALPRLYATVSFPRDRLSGPAAGAVQMEWYDLARADELLAALDGQPPASDAPPGEGGPATPAAVEDSP